MALPGFGLDGKHIPAKWIMTVLEPIQKTVLAWIAFIKDHTNFKNNVPVVAGVAGAPDLDGFVAQALVAPTKPLPHVEGQGTPSRSGGGADPGQGQGGVHCTAHSRSRYFRVPCSSRHPQQPTP